MFDYSFVHLSTFVLAVLLLEFTPGPDLAYILAQTARRGRRAGYIAMVGTWGGSVVHILLATLGLSAILATSALAFSLVKWAGALYLVWLGLQMIFGRHGEASIDAPVPQASARSIFLQGLLVSTLNPKVALFFLAFLPQFVVPGAGPASAQLLFHGGLILLIAALLNPFYVILGSKAFERISRQTRLFLWLNRGLGAIFIGLGLRLATARAD